MKFPRVLIVGETFRLNGGGGITMTNLFKDWPGDSVGVITDRIEETNPNTDYLYYQLGSEEVKFPFPFYIIQSYYHSGPYNFTNRKKLNILTESKRNNIFNIKKSFHPFFDNFLKRTGLDSRFYSIGISESLKRWVLHFKPDIIYVQPFHHRTMRFGNLLYDELKIPYAIHIMDDSIRYINKSIILRKKRQQLIEKDFKKLMHNAKVRLSISEAMSSEYLRRYGKIFVPFRNPIEIGNWIPYQRRNTVVDPDKIKIIYTGRLFSPTLFSLIDMCQATDRLNRNNKKVELDIYSHDKNTTFFKIIKQLEGVNLQTPVNVKEMPHLIQQYDIFFLCLDFDKQAQKYSQFSISTRTSEGMISAIPVLVYAPTYSALYKYFDKTSSGCLVGERKPDLLETAILKLWHDLGFRESLSKNAVKTVLDDSDATIVRDEFRKALTNL